MMNMKFLAKQKKLLSTTVLLSLLVQGCSTTQSLPMPAVEQMDLERFMGDWYVVASIPTYFEKDAYNPVERYSLNADGSVKTIFSYNKGSIAGPSKSMNAIGFIPDSEKPSIWEMQFVWPVRADYRVVYLSPDYEFTIVGRTKRDYLWIMSRQQPVPEDEFSLLMERAAELGYSLDKVRVSNWQQGSAIDKP